MQKVRKLNDTIQYAELYRQLSNYHQERRAFSLGGVATAKGIGDDMDMPPDYDSFAQKFFNNEASLQSMVKSSDFLNQTLEQTRAKLKAKIYADNSNAMAMDGLSEIFGVFQENAEKPIEELARNAPYLSLSDVPGATQYPSEDGIGDIYAVGGSKTDTPIAMVAMKAEGMGNYNTLYNNQNNIKKSPYYGIDVTKMSLGQVMEFAKKGGAYWKHNKDQYGAKTTATGYYQMLGGTIDDILTRGGKALGITKDSLYNKETQDKMYIWYMSDTISRLKTLSGMEQRVMARWEAFRDNDKTIVRQDSKGKDYNIYTAKNRDLLRKVIYEHLNVYHPNHPLVNKSGLGSKKGT